MFTQSSDRAVSTGTSNLTHLLNDEHQARLRDVITPDLLLQAFGLGHPLNIPAKGYTDPEWYWRGPENSVMGIGFRWGRPRLRGYLHPCVISSPEDVANSFLEFIFLELENMTTNHEEENETN